MLLVGVKIAVKWTIPPNKATHPPTAQHLHSNFKSQASLRIGNPAFCIQYRLQAELTVR